MSSISFCNNLVGWSEGRWKVHGHNNSGFALIHGARYFRRLLIKPCLTEVQPNTAPFFSEEGLRKFVFASELFVPRPYFICHLTAKRRVKILWLPIQFPFQRRWSKSELKMKNYSGLLSNLAKEGVGKRLFNLSSFIGIKFYVKVNSSLVRSLQIQVGNWDQM